MAKKVAKKKRAKVDLAEIRTAVADYIWSDVWDCRKQTVRLAKLLKVPKFPDGSGYNFDKFRTKGE